MKIVCLVKYVPDISRYEHDIIRDQNTLKRENVKMLINPDDSKGLEYALQLKDSNHDIFIEVVTMGPISLEKKVMDLIRIGVDKCTIISDISYRGSDSYVTSKIISKYLSGIDYDFIISGSNAMDGSTGHVGPQVAELLDLEQVSNVIDILELDESSVAIEADFINQNVKLKMKLPCLISFSRGSKYKLRYVSYDNLTMNVEEELFYVTNEELKFPLDEVGLTGSPTQVKKIYKSELNQRSQIIVKADDEGIEQVYQILKENGLN